MAFVAFGDRTSIAAWVELPSDDAGTYVWKTVDLADVKGSLIPRDDPQVEAVCADGAGRILILQESPAAGRAARLGGAHGRDPDRPRDPRGPPAPRLVGRRRELAGRGRRVHAERPPPDRQGEGPGGLRRIRARGRRAVRVRPGVRAQGAARAGRPTRAIASSSRSRSGTRRSSWRPTARTSATSRSDPTAGSTCSATSPSRSPGSGNWSSAIPSPRADEVWELPLLDGKPEGLALTRNGRAIVALDTKQAKENLVLLEPPIAEGATS